MWDCQRGSMTEVVHLMVPVCLGMQQLWDRELQTPLRLLPRACSRGCIQACPGMCQTLPCSWQGNMLPGVLQRGFREMPAAQAS